MTIDAYSDDDDMHFLDEQTHPKWRNQKLRITCYSLHNAVETQHGFCSNSRSDPQLGAISERRRPLEKHQHTSNAAHHTEIYDPAWITGTPTRVTSISRKMHTRRRRSRDPVEDARTQSSPVPVRGVYPAPTCAWEGSRRTGSTAFSWC